jgi:hypothetical protein
MADALINSNSKDYPLKAELSAVNGAGAGNNVPPSRDQAPVTDEPSKGKTPATAQPVKKPVSPAKLAANRKNASKSTGPKTAAGKATVSRNALNTGLYAQKWLAVTGDEQHMANRLLGELRQQFPADDLLDELDHELFVQAYVQRWRFIQASGGMIDARRGQITPGAIVDTRDAESLVETENRLHTITTALDQLRRVGRVTPGTLTELEAVVDCSESAAAALIAEMRRITAEADEPGSNVDVGKAQQLAETFAQDLADTKAALEARIDKQVDAAYRQAALPSDAESKKFVRHDRDTLRNVRRVRDAIARRWGRAPARPRAARKTA